MYQRYVQERELGRGQFGSVHLGRWLGIHVALKELFVGPRDEPHGATAEATAEARMLASRPLIQPHPSRTQQLKQG
jgi:serine/threonine protein kinase